MRKLNLAVSLVLLDKSSIMSDFSIILPHPISITHTFKKTAFARIFTFLTDHPAIWPADVVPLSAVKRSPNTESGRRVGISSHTHIHGDIYRVTKNYLLLLSWKNEDL